MSSKTRYHRALKITAPWSFLAFLASASIGFMPLLLTQPLAEYEAETFIRYQEFTKEKDALIVESKNDSSINQSAFSKEILLLNTTFQRFWQQELNNLGNQVDSGNQKATPRTILGSRQFIIEPQIQSESDKTESRFRHKVRYRDTKSDRSASILRSFTKALSRSSRNENIYQQKLQVARLEEEEKSLKQQLDEVSRKLETFSSLEKPTTVQAGEASSLVSEISSLQQNLRQLRVQIQSLGTEIEGTQKRLGLTPQEAYLSAALSADPIISKLQSQIYDVKAQMEKLIVELQPRHPEVVEQQQQLDAFEKQLQQRISDVVGRTTFLKLSTNSDTSIDQIRQLSSLDPARQELANQLAGLQTRREYLENQRGILASAEQRLRERLSAFQSQYNLPRIELSESVLRGEFEGLKQLYEKARLSGHQAELRLKSAVSNWNSETSITQRETTSFPWLEAIIFPAIGIIIGAFLFAFIPLIVLNDRLLNAEEAKAILKDLGLANVLVKLIPTIPGYSRNEIALAVRRNTKYLGEFEGLRTEIGNQSPILVTSITGGDGKSSTAYNLALASSQTGRRTLIIELDLRSTSVATNISTATLGKEITEKGSSDTYYQENLADKIQPAQALMPNEIDVSNLFILPSMRVAQNLQQVLESDSVVDLFNQVSRDYDYIVVDAPSMSVDNAARSLLNNVKAFLLVVRPGNSPVDRFKEVVSFLSHYDNEKFVGVVVTAAGNIHKNLLK